MLGRRCAGICLIWRGRGWRRRCRWWLIALVRAKLRQDRAGLGLLVGLLVAVAVNAFATGALSAPVDRYQARIIWLLPLAAALGLAPRFGIGLTDTERVRARMKAWQSTSSSSSPSS